MEQYTGDTKNYVVGNISLGEGSETSIEYPCGDCDEMDMSEDEQKVGDHSEMN